MVRILIADDYEAARRAIRRLLEGRPGWEVCGEAVDGLAVVQKTAELKPDVVILDLASLEMVAGGLCFWRLAVCLLWQATNLTCHSFGKKQ